MLFDSLREILLFYKECDIMKPVIFWEESLVWRNTV